METTKKQFWDNYGECTLKGLLDSKQLAKDALEIYIKHYKQSIVKIKDAGALIKHHKNGVRWMDEKIEELEAKEKSVNSSISKKDLEELKTVIDESIKPIDCKMLNLRCPNDTLNFISMAQNRLIEVCKCVEQILEKINSELSSYDTPQKTDAPIAWHDPDAPKTVWLADNRNSEFHSPVFSSKEKCKVYCDKKNGFRTFSDESIYFVVPTEVVVDAFNNWGDRVTLNEQIKEQMNEPK